ncbi:hypothetical protein H0G86_003015 [Trichoderma simmonsii]|uniref:Uncharacterized protein n=1 Tax=Trichoderma simmonsii TaxID=1491479 RepID=A0A8G0L9S0_9HYPO|nr:hypothetical protein H0G86_003015 [Trichoderma simmonsii]
MTCIPGFSFLLFFYFFRSLSIFFVGFLIMFGVGVQRKKAFHHGVIKKTAMGTAQFAILPCLGKFSLDRSRILSLDRLRIFSLDGLRIFSLDRSRIFSFGLCLDCSIPLVAAQSRSTALSVEDNKKGRHTTTEILVTLLASRLRRWSLLYWTNELVHLSGLFCFFC